MEILLYVVGGLLLIGGMSFYMSYRRHQREQQEIRRKAAEQTAWKAGRDAAKPAPVNRSGSLHVPDVGDLQVRATEHAGYYSLEYITGKDNNKGFVLIATCLLHGGYYLLKAGKGKLLAIPQSVSPVPDPAAASAGTMTPPTQRWPQSLVHVLHLDGSPSETLVLADNLLVCHALLVRGGTHIAYLTRTGTPGAPLPTTGKAGGELQVWLAPIEAPNSLQPLYYDKKLLKDCKSKLLEGSYLVEEDERLICRGWLPDPKYRGSTLDVALHTTPRTTSAMMSSNAA